MSAKRPPPTAIQRNASVALGPRASTPGLAGAAGRGMPGDVVTSPTISLPAYSHGFVRFGNGGGNGLKAC